MNKSLSDWGACLFAAIVSDSQNILFKWVGLIPQRGIARDGLLGQNNHVINIQYGFNGWQKGNFF
jgi:hypothetical protein